MIHQGHVYHGHLIQNHHIRFQRMFFISLKDLLTTVGNTKLNLQQTMYRFCLSPGGFSHTLCRTTCRCRQHEFFMILFQKFQKHINDRGLTGARTAGNDQNPLTQRRQYRFPLFLGKLDLLLLFDLLHPQLILLLIN